MHRLIVAGLLVLVACGGGAPAVPTMPPAPLAIGQAGVLPDGEVVTVKATEIPVARRDTAPPVGMAYLGADVEWCAGPHPEGGTARTTGLVFQLVMPDDTRLPPSLGEREPSFLNAALPAGACNRGWVTFAAPAGVVPKAIALRSLLWAVR